MRTSEAKYDPYPSHCLIKMYTKIFLSVNCLKNVAEQFVCDLYI